MCGVRVIIRGDTRRAGEVSRAFCSAHLTGLQLMTPNKTTDKTQEHNTNNDIEDNNSMPKQTMTQQNLKTVYFTRTYPFSQCTPPPPPPSLYNKHVPSLYMTLTSQSEADTTTGETPPPFFTPPLFPLREQSGQY